MFPQVRTETHNDVDHFNLFAMHLSNTLEGAGIPAEIVKQILAAIAPLADDIVTAKSA